MNQATTLSGTTLVLALIGSAGVGAVVSSLFTMIGQVLERKSRRDELVFAKAIEMAQFNMNVAIRALGDRPGKLMPVIYSADYYYRALKGMLKQGELPPEFKDKIEEDIRKLASGSTQPSV